MRQRIHFFALQDATTRSLCCGRSYDGDGWTALPAGVTCPECLQIIEAVLAEDRRASAPAGDELPPSR